MNSPELEKRLDRLERADRDLSNEVGELHKKLDTALLTLTHNVNNLTRAIDVLQESQQLNNKLHRDLIILQERSLVVPELQRELNRVVVDQATQNVILKGIRFLAGSVVVSVVGIAVAVLFGA